MFDVVFSSGEKPALCDAMGVSASVLSVISSGENPALCDAIGVSASVLSVLSSHYLDYFGPEYSEPQ